jgi:hypothetical protein
VQVVHPGLLLAHQNLLDLVLMIYFQDLLRSDLLVLLGRELRIDMLMSSRGREHDMRKSVKMRIDGKI